MRATSAEFPISHDWKPELRSDMVKAMADTVSPEKRSEIMSRVKGKDTTPELAVRSYLHRRGLRFRLHRNDLPGRPDLVLPKYRSVVLVHGCFWHRHPGCPSNRIPKTRVSYWKEKLNANVARDKRNQAALKEQGWHVHVVWECEIGAENLERLVARIRGAGE